MWTGDQVALGYLFLLAVDNRRMAAQDGSVKIKIGNSYRATQRTAELVGVATNCALEGVTDRPTSVCVTVAIADGPAERAWLWFERPAPGSQEEALLEAMIARLQTLLPEAR